MRTAQVYLPRQDFAQVRRVPDVAGFIQALPGPEKVLKGIFLKWNPLGKNATAEGASRETVRGWLRAMVTVSPSDEATESFVDQSEPMGWRLLGLLSRFGNKVEIYNHAEYLKRRRKGTAGYYIARHRAVMIDAFSIDHPNCSVVRHEMGHALEHLMSSLCLDGHALSTNLWHGFAEDRLAFVTPYAATKPAEYFAESVEAYFKPHSRVWLEHNDPGMHAFLTALFEISNM